MRTRLRSAGLSLTVALSVSLACCTAGAPHPAAGSLSRAGGPPTAPALSLAAARSLLSHYERVNNTANARRSPRLEATVEAPPQLTLDQAEYVIAGHENRSIKPFTYRSPAFYIPALPATTHQWFAASAITGSGKHAERQFLLFIQQYPSGPWKVDSAPASAGGGLAGGSLPVALSPAGTAVTVPAGDRRLTGILSQLPARHAELINGKPQATVPAFATGQWTSALARDVKSFRKAYGKVGWKYHDHWDATSEPVYVLRSKNGGAVMWYFLKDQQSGIRTGTGRPLRSGGVIEALAGSSRITHRFTIISVSEFVAVIPPKGNRKIVVKGGFTGNVGATSS
jgi:hypothetical protein